MSVVHKKEFGLGGLMLVSFFVVLACLFMPWYGPHKVNYFELSDKMFNSISKGSTNYFDVVREKAQAYVGSNFDVTILEGNSLVADAADILRANGATVEETDGGIRVQGDLGVIVGDAIQDAEDMFHNKGSVLANRYHVPEEQIASARKSLIANLEAKDLNTDEFSGNDDAEAKLAMYCWHMVLSDMDKALKKQKRFKEAAMIKEVMSKAVEVGYNYYGIAPESAGSRALMLTFDLVFYVIYTLWYGYAIFFMSEGWGLRMSAGNKSEQ